MISKDTKTIPRAVGSSHKMYHSDNHPRSLQGCIQKYIVQTFDHKILIQNQTLFEAIYN